MKRIAVAAGATLLALLLVLVGRTLRTESRQPHVEPAAPVAIDADAAAQRLAGALRYRTVSNQDPAAFDTAAFRGLHDYLAQRFPRVAATLQRETVNDYSLLYTWPGRGADKPILLLAHLDVVPIEPGTEDQWQHPPFDGVVADGFVWGRGALDDKSSALATLEAVEWLLAQGYEPPRTVMLAFGHDEEISGHHGAQAIAERLAQRGVSPELVLDEGGTILVGLVPGLSAPVASIGLGEKGYVSVELSAHSAGGHSSIPPARTAISVLSDAVHRLGRHQVPSNLGAAMGDSFEYLGPEMAFPLRVVFANLWLFGPLVERQLAASPQTNAAIRTTTAPTIFQGGVKENQLPAAARAVVNFRILPGETVATTVEHVRRTVADPAVQVGVLGEGNDPSPMSDTDSPAFAYLARTIRATHPDVLVSPFLVLGGTDARHYTGLSRNVFRFSPYRTGPDDLHRFHGTNERVAVADYAGMIRFYIELIRGLDGLDSDRRGQTLVQR
ncbi:MAG: M20 family peptidase [Deltaproteobacteria bacterium]|nr:M20 family peptidase [Deltaproteobacteria bacterium]